MRIKKFLVFTFVYIQDIVFNLLAKNRAVHTTLFAPGFERYRLAVGRWRAWRTFEQAAKKVPAYREFLREYHHATKLAAGSQFSDIPEMDKNNYIRKWSIQERSLNGRLPVAGVVVDESSGSSGTPTSWVRGAEERRATRSLLQVGFNRSTNVSEKPIFVLNAFSLGAWATGMNVTASLTDVAIIKSIGPDVAKIINTIQEFGEGYTYIILSYPPFLKSLFDQPGIDWKQYDVVAGFGGEGISENMRTYLQKYARGGVFGSYGASDLEINIALETMFTVALRRAFASHSELADRFTKTKEYGVLPMVFQFNPYDYVVETNKKGELLVSIARKENINPRIRYNIHDRGHVIRIKDIWPALQELSLQDVMQAKVLDLPLLLHYGRSDLSVDYNGAVVAPDTLRDIIYGDSALAEITENHRLISFEDEQSNRQLHICLQLRDGVHLKKSEKRLLRQQIFQAFFQQNKDFYNACKTSDRAVWPSLELYPYRKGPFANDGRKLKNEYVWHLESHQSAEAQMNLDTKLEEL